MTELDAPIRRYVSGGRDYSVGVMPPTEEAATAAAKIMYKAFTERYVGMRGIGRVRKEEITHDHIRQTVDPDNKDFVRRLRTKVERASERNACYVLGIRALEHGIEYVGFAKFERHGAKGGEVAEIDVLPEQQGNGMGMALMRYGCSYLNETSEDGTMTLDVIATNTTSQRIYRKWGFEETGESRLLRPFVNGPRVRQLGMAADLSLLDDNLANRGCREITDQAG